MITRRSIAWITYGSLGTGCFVAFACSSNSPPGFQTSDGGSGLTNNNNNGNNNSSTSNSGSQSTFNGSSGGNTNGTGSTSTGNSGSTGTGSTANNTNTSTSTSTATTGQAFCNNAAQPMYAMACSAPSVGTPIALSACVPTAIENNSDGYVVATGDGQSTACVDTNMLCAMGTTVSLGTPPNYALYGSGISIGFGTAGFAPAQSSLTLSVTSIPPNGLEVSVASGGVQYYAEVPVGTTMPVTIPLSKFNTTGYLATPDGGSFNGTAAITSVGLQANSAAAASTWSFCVTTLTL